MAAASKIIHLCVSKDICDEQLPAERTSLDAELLLLLHIIFFFLCVLCVYMIVYIRSSFQYLFLLSFSKFLSDFSSLTMRIFDIDIPCIHYTDTYIAQASLLLLHCMRAVGMIKAIEKFRCEGSERERQRGKEPEPDTTTNALIDDGDSSRFCTYTYTNSYSMLQIYAGRQT